MLFTALFAVCVISCKRYPETQEQKHGEPQLSAMKSAIPINSVIANPANPFDYVGEIHNRGLQQIVNYTVATGDTSQHGKKEILRKFFKDQFNAEPKGETDPNLRAIILKDYRLVHSSLKMSPLAHSFVDKMNQCIDGIKSLDEFDAFKKKFIDLETQILRSKLSGFERDGLLKTASVMRHSAYFWFNFANNDEKAVTMGLLRKIAGVITGIAADGTSALYYAFVSANIFKMLEECIEMSEMCGFYTGGFSY